MLTAAFDVSHFFFLAANVGKLAEQTVGEVDGERHVVESLVAGIAEHHALVTCALCFKFAALYSAVDVGALFVKG